MTNLTYEQKQDIAEKVKVLGLTLLGKPCRVCGLRLDWPIVCAGDMAIEYSWSSIKRHVDNKQNF